jgi:hypothetical protein
MGKLHVELYLNKAGFKKYNFRKKNISLKRVRERERERY